MSHTSGVKISTRPTWQDTVNFITADQPCIENQI